MNFLKQFYSKYKMYKEYRHLGKYNIYGFLPSSTYMKYPRPCTFSGKLVLNAGCGGNTYPSPNVTNMDLCAGPEVNVVWDMSKTPLPFNDESFDLIIANHVLEHVPNWFECFKEFARILKPNGVIEVWIPPISSDGAFSYRDHINRINGESFMGIGGMRRPGTNLAAKEELTTLSHIDKVTLQSRKYRPAIKWWTHFAPNFLLAWMSTYLRNVISEEGYFFLKGN